MKLWVVLATVCVFLLVLPQEAQGLGCTPTCACSFINGVNSAATKATGTGGFTLTLGSVTSYYIHEHIVLTLNVPTGSNFVAVELEALGAATGNNIGGTSNEAGTWVTTASKQVSNGQTIPSSLWCNSTNNYQIVAGAVTQGSPTYTTSQFTWIGPPVSTFGTVTFTAAVFVDNLDYYQITASTTLPYLAAGLGCVNPKTGNTTWAPHPICNGHGTCLANNTCICNGTYTGPGCYTNLACGSGYQGPAGKCTACPVSTFKTGYGATNTSTTYDTTVCRHCSDNIGLPYLGLAGKYALLTYSAMTVSATKPFVSGDIADENAGSYVDSSASFGTKFDQIAGNIHLIGDLDSQQAITDATAALTGATFTECPYYSSVNLTHVTLKPGNYCWHTQLYAQGNVVLDAGGDALAVWRFIVKSGNAMFGIQPTLAGADFTLANGASALRVFWFVYGTVTVNAGTTVEGTVVAKGAITVGANGHVTGGLISTTSNIIFSGAATVGDTALPQIYTNGVRFTSPLASISWLNCSVASTVCAAGRYYSATYGNCQYCALGTYKAATGDQSCSLCNQAHTTPSTGSTAMSQCSTPLCPPGRYGDPTGLNCKYCPAATYKSTYGPQACTACPVGLNTTSGVGHTTSTDCRVAYACPPGYSGAAGSCHICALGTYNNLTGLTTVSCTSCPSGYYSIAPGASSLAQCLLVQPNPAGADLCSQFNDKPDLCLRFDIEGCAFNSTTGLCVKQPCSFFTAQGDCNDVNVCRWYDSKCNNYVASSSTAYAVCAAISAGYGTTYLSPADMAAACVAQPMCEWLCGTNHCVVDRNIVATTPDVNHTTCIQDGYAIWIQNTADCYDPFNDAHTFTSYSDPHFANFTCPPGVCVTKGRFNPTTVCDATNQESCSGAGAGEQHGTGNNQSPCLWIPQGTRCLANENTLPYDVQCDFCAFRTAYIDNLWNVGVATIGEQTCEDTVGCVQSTDCALKPHCVKHLTACIPDDTYLCPLLPTQYECTTGVGSGICALYNSTGVCASDLHPPAGWPVYTGSSSVASASSFASIESSFSDAFVGHHFNFEVDVHTFTYNAQTNVLTFYVDTALNWNPNAKSAILIKVGTGGVPSTGFNFALSTVSGVPTSPTLVPTFLDFAQALTLNHNFTGVRNMGGDLSDVFQPLYTHGIASSVVLLPDPFLGPVLRYTLNLNLATLPTVGASAGVTGQFFAIGSQQQQGTLLASTDLTIPLTVVWHTGLTTSSSSTTNLNVVINGAGHANVIVQTQRGYGVTLTLNDVYFTSQFVNDLTAMGTVCQVGAVAEILQFTVAYSSHSANQLYLGPLTGPDLVMQTNCYNAQIVSLTPAASCTSGVCESSFTIATECRVPNKYGDTFTACAAPRINALDGLFEVQVNPWFCDATGVQTASSCAGQVLLDNTVKDTLKARVLAPTGNVTYAKAQIEDALLAGVLVNLTSSLASLKTADVNGIVSAANRFVPVVVYFENSDSLNNFVLQIDTAGTVLSITDKSGTVIGTPTLAYLISNGAVHVNPKAQHLLGQDSVAACEAVIGCDDFVLDGFGLVNLYPAIDSANASLVIEYAPEGVTIPAARRLLAVVAVSSSDSYTTTDITASGTNLSIHFESTVFAGHPTKSSGLNDGQIAGIVIGVVFGVAFIIIFAVLIWWGCAAPGANGYSTVTVVESDAPSTASLSSSSAPPSYETSGRAARSIAERRRLRALAGQ